VRFKLASKVMATTSGPARSDVLMGMNTTQRHAEPINATKYAAYVSSTVIRDNGAFVSVDVYTSLVGAPVTYSSEQFDSTRHFGGFNIDRIDAHAAALKWVSRITGQKP
jgi:hypothetical protein